MASTLTTTISSTDILDKNIKSIFGATSSTDKSLWYKVHPGIRDIGFMFRLEGSSAGAPVTGAVEIQASNDGQTRIDTLLGTISLSSAGSPAADGLAIDAHWGYVRAVISSGTTMSSGTSVNVSVSPHMIK